jgi:hypothetical protein
MNQQQPHEDHGKDFVDITIDGKTYPIHRGHQTVVAIKTVGSIPLAYELEQVIDGKLTPLADDGAVVIKGDEQFVGHPRSAGSS